MQAYPPTGGRNAKASAGLRIDEKWVQTPSSHLTCSRLLTGGYTKLVFMTKVLPNSTNSTLAIPRYINAQKNIYYDS